MIVLEEKLYTSEETAGLLGITPRTLYRYIKDKYIEPETRTKSGTYRFTRTHIYKYLYPDKYKKIIELIEKREGSNKQFIYVDNSIFSNPSKTFPVKAISSVVKEVEDSSVPEELVLPEVSKPVVESPAPLEVKENGGVAEVKEETVKKLDSVEDFDAAIKNLEDKLVQEVPSQTTPMTEKQFEEVKDVKENIEIKPVLVDKVLPNNNEVIEPVSDSEWKYYLNSNKTILDLAKEVNSLSAETGRRYASTMQGGLSLHHDIEEFNVVYFYIEPDDLNWWVKQLELQVSTKEEGNICLIPDGDSTILDNSYKLRGLFVVDDERLIQDLMSHGEKELARTLL